MIQKIKQLKNKMRGSILAYTLIVLTIMLMTALSVASVTILDKKSATSTAGSTQAFAVADSGSELILGYHYRNDATRLNNIPNSTCDTSDGTVTLLNVSGGEAKITFYGGTDGETKIDCDDSSAPTLAEVSKVKSVGIYSGSSRAVEVAVAAVGDTGIGTCYDPDDMLYIQFAETCPSGFSLCTRTKIENASKKGCLPDAAQYRGSTTGEDGCFRDDTVANQKGSLYAEKDGPWDYGTFSSGSCGDGDEKICCK